VTTSSETETRSRGALDLDRDGALRELVAQPSSEAKSRSRVVRPSSEADLYRGGAVPLEQSGVSPEGGWADCLTGCGPVGWFCARVWVCFAFVFMSLKRVSPSCLGDPYGRPRHTGPSSLLVDVGSGEANADTSSCLRMKMTTSLR
jgi:hypothetical protein